MPPSPDTPPSTPLSGAPRASGGTLIGRTGFGYFPVALLSRLPFAMMVIGVLTLTVAARGSVQLGGLMSATVGLGIACFGPLIGASADRFGQRPTLLIVSALNSIVLCALSWIAFSPAPEAALFAASFCAGATAPQVSPMSRSRLVTIISTELPPQRRPKLISSVLAYESAADEVVFVFGPVLVGALAVAFEPWVPVVGAGVLTLVFVTAFALHRTAAPAQSRAERAADLDPVSSLLRPRVIVTVAGMLSVGVIFGSTLTSLTSFMRDRGDADAAGLIYGVMGVGSAVFAIGIAWLTPRFTLRARWLVFAAMILCGTLVLRAADGMPGIVAGLALTGIGIGPLLVTIYGLGAERSPRGRSATLMSMLGTGITVGQSIGAAVTGTLAETLGTDAAFVMPLIAALLMMTTGAANWPLSRPARVPVTPKL